MQPIAVLMIEHRLIDRMVNLLKIEYNNIMTENDIDDTFLLGVIDFFRTYADKNHHGKEEDILFKKLDKKNISFELRRILVKLTEDHKIARKMIWALDAARGKHSQKLNNFTKEISLIIKEIVELYQKHIEIEDKYFFIPSMKYFTTQEQEEMLREFIDFDRNSNLTRYIYLVEQFENSKLQNIKMDKNKKKNNSVNIFSNHEYEHISHTQHYSNSTNKPQHQSHDNHKMHNKSMIDDFKRRFIVSLIITIPILVLSPIIQEWTGINIYFTWSIYLLFLFSSFVFFYGGWPFLKGIFEEIKSKTLGMMTLIAVAISVAYFYSAAVVFGLKGEIFFWELATLIDIMLLGHWIEMKSIMSASNALEKLAQLMPDTAHLINGIDIIEIKIKELSKGNHVLIKPGEKIPSDGIVLKGNSYVNESMLTGESKPVEKKEGNSVIGGSINGDGSLEIVVKNTGDDSYLSKVISLVREAQASKSKTQLLADKAAFWLTVIALTVGFATLFFWILYGKDASFSIERMATVMVITCPHALGLAVPLVVAVSTSLSAKNGLLIRNRTAFENSRKITTVVFDKTGTLTEGKFGVSLIQSFNKKINEKEIIKMAASLEINSEHPIATGIVLKVKEMNVETTEVIDFQAIKGRGVEGKINGKLVKIVSPGYLREHGIQIPENLEIKKSDTVVFVVMDNKLLGLISLSDKIRPESFGAIYRLKKAGIKCWMLTGDNKKTAKTVADELHLDGFFAEVLPHEKQEKIKELQSKGEFVAMIGDGVNDAPALAQADVGIAVGSGTDIAAETADIILVNSNPDDVSSLILFGKATYKKMAQNLFWATGYNVVAIPLAAGVLYGKGILLSPAVGAIFMSISTIIVAINAKLLRI